MVLQTGAGSMRRIQEEFTRKDWLGIVPDTLSFL